MQTMAVEAVASVTQMATSLKIMNVSLVFPTATPVTLHQLAKSVTSPLTTLLLAESAKSVVYRVVWIVRASINASNATKTIASSWPTPNVSLVLWRTAWNVNRWQNVGDAMKTMGMNLMRAPSCV